MAFLADVQELKCGLIIFHRTDVKHQNWYCRVKLPSADRYKTISLKTSDINAAREKAFEQDADLRFRLKHDVPIFNRPFSQIAQDYLATQIERAETGYITKVRARNVESIIRAQLNRYVGPIQIHLIGQDRWDSYPVWRRKNGRGFVREQVSEATIRVEMSIFRSIMAYAASKKFIPASQIFKGNLPRATERREEFTREEYRKLHTFARGWVNKASKPTSRWTREVTYNFVLIMCNTGMRPPEAKNLRWRDVSIGKDKEGRDLVVLNVRGKSKFRRLVAAGNVAEYLERIRAIAKSTEPDDYVFTNHNGKRAITLYSSLISELLDKAGLRTGPAGTPRSTYCFRHTYATLRLSEGVDVYFLAEQMGTSVQMIEKHYGHINPVKNADRILMGMHVWEATEVEPKVLADNARVNAGAAKPSATKPKGKHRAARHKP